MAPTGRGQATGLDASTAAQFSFLLSIPVLGAATLLVFLLLLAGQTTSQLGTQVTEKVSTWSAPNMRMTSGLLSSSAFWLLSFRAS